MSQNGFRDEVYPEIYSGYPTILDAIYSAHSVETDREKRDCLYRLQESAIELWETYRSSHVEADYTPPHFQEVYLLRYFFPYSLLVPSILYYHLEDFFHLDDELLIASFFGCGPGPELYGLMYYLRHFQSGVAMISASMLDLAPTGWEYGRNIISENLSNQIWDPGLYEISEFELNLAGRDGNFLIADSENWVKESNLIIIQNCLNEIPASKHEQILTNVTHVVDIMKPGALMLIIERHGYPVVRELLGNIRSTAEEFEDIQTRHRPADDSQYIEMRLNLDYVPEELQTYLFSQVRDPRLRLATQIKYHWLAISKQ